MAWSHGNKPFLVFKISILQKLHPKQSSGADPESHFFLGGGDNKVQYLAFFFLHQYPYNWSIMFFYRVWGGGHVRLVSHSLRSVPGPTRTYVSSLSFGKTTVHSHDEGKLNSYECAVYSDDVDYLCRLYGPKFCEPQKGSSSLQISKTMLI